MAGSVPWEVPDDLNVPLHNETENAVATDGRGNAPDTVPIETIGPKPVGLETIGTTPMVLPALPQNFFDVLQNIVSVSDSDRGSDISANKAGEYISVNETDGDIVTNSTSGDISANGTDSDISANATNSDIVTNSTSGDIVTNSTDSNVSANATNSDIVTNSTNDDMSANDTDSDISANATNSDTYSTIVAKGTTAVPVLEALIDNITFFVVSVLGVLMMLPFATLLSIYAFRRRGDAGIANNPDDPDDAECEEFADRQGSWAPPDLQTRNHVHETSKNAWGAPTVWRDPPRKEQHAPSTPGGRTRSTRSFASDGASSGASPRVPPPPDHAWGAAPSRRWSDRRADYSRSKGLATSASGASASSGSAATPPPRDRRVAYGCTETAAPPPRDRRAEYLFTKTGSSTSATSSGSSGTWRARSFASESSGSVVAPPPPLPHTGEGVPPEWVTADPDWGWTVPARIDLSSSDLSGPA